jgi:hypothetical protein
MKDATATRGAFLPLSEAELDELDRLISAASPAPWQPVVGESWLGADFIQLGDDGSLPEMTVDHDGDPAPIADVEFIAAARNFLPRLLAEVRRGRQA